MPYLKARGTRLLGPRTSADAPGITISGTAMAARYSMLVIAGSEVLVSNLRFTNIIEFPAIEVLVGPTRGPGPGPQEITDVRIEGNHFDKGTSASKASGISIGPKPGSADTRVRGVTVARNRFRNLGQIQVGDDEATIGVHAPGSRSLIEDLHIVGNTFEGCVFSVIFVLNSATNAVIRDTRIVRNTLVGSDGIFFDVNGAESVGGSITRTLVAGNSFSAGNSEAIALIVWGGLFGASGNTVSSVWFHNNIVGNYHGGVFVIGGMGGSRNNRSRTCRSPTAPSRRPEGRRFEASALLGAAIGMIAPSVTAVNVLELVDMATLL
jgi:hypothetical protein